MTNYISIKSVLYDLSLILDDRYYNEQKMLEWATQAFFLLNIEQKFINKVCLLTIKNHSSKLPKDFKYLVQGAFMPLGKENDEHHQWQAMSLSTSPYHSSVCIDDKLIFKNCKESYKIESNHTITTTFNEGTVILSYLAYPSDDNGLLIPDDEAVKEAILYYVLHKYWMSKYIMKEEGAEQRMEYFREKWQIYSIRAFNVSLPDVGKLENLKQIRYRLVPKNNRFDELFLTLNKNEVINDSTSS